jgi:hypothetical protein
MPVSRPATALFALLLAAACGSHAQQAFAPATPPPPVDANPNIGPAATLSWAPPELSTLAGFASWHTDFVVDRQMLTLAGNLYGVDDPTRQAIARLNGIALHLYRFPTTSYDPTLVQSVRAEYDGLGWKHVETSKPVSGPVVGSQTNGRTDVWLNMRGVNISGAVILLAGPGSVSLVGVSGDLHTLDLLHLRGHFGIPNFPDDALPH